MLMRRSSDIPNSSASADVVPAVVKPLPGAPPLVVSVADVPILATPSAHGKLEPSRDEYAAVDMPTDLPLPKGQDVPRIMVDEIAPRNQEHLMIRDDVSREPSIPDGLRYTKQDGEADPQVDVEDTRDDLQSGSHSTRSKDRTVKELAEEEQRSNRDRLYGQVMQNEIHEDTFGNSMAEDTRFLHRDDVHDANIADNPSQGPADGLVDLSPKGEKKRREKKGGSARATDGKRLAESVDGPPPRLTSPPNSDNRLESSDRPGINDHRLDDDLHEVHSPVYRTEAPSSPSEDSDRSTPSDIKSTKKARKQKARSKKGKHDRRSNDRLGEHGSPSPSALDQSEAEERGDDANVKDGNDEDEIADAEQPGSGSAKGKSTKPRAVKSMKARLKGVKEKVTGKKKEKRSRRGEEVEIRDLPSDEEDAASEPSSPIDHNKRVSRKGKGKDDTHDSEILPSPSLPSSKTAAPPSRKGRTFQVGGVSVDPSMAVGVILLGVAIFRGISGSSASPSNASTSGTDTDPVAATSTITSIYMFGGIAVLGGVVLFGLWSQGNFQKSKNHDQNDHQGTAMGQAEAAKSSRDRGSPEKAGAQNSEDVEQEDKLLQDAQEQVKALFPQRNMQSAAFAVFYDLVHAPWQDPDPESLQRLRTLARKEWGKEHKPKFKESVASLREVAVQLFADYLRVHDRGAYLSGELLRVEVASGHEAIRISAFPGENVDAGSDMSREKANWKRGLQTIRQLPDEWSQMFPGQDMPPIEIVACRPPADFDARQFQFLRECAKAPRQVDRQARKRYQEVKKQWLSCKVRGLPLSGIRRLVDGVKDDTRAYMLHDLFELTQPTRIVIDYLPHRHRQAEALGWKETSTSALRRASCFGDVAKACAAYTQSNRLDILDLGPCLPMKQRSSEPTQAGDMSFAFSKTRVGILRIALDECTDSEQDDGVSEVECLAATMCDRATGILPMFTGDTPAWLVLHVGNAKQRGDFKDTVEGLLFARSTKSFRVKQLLAFMSRVCTTTEASTSSSRIWTDAEIREIELSLDSSS